MAEELKPALGQGLDIAVLNQLGTDIRLACRVGFLVVVHFDSLIV